MHPPPEEHYTAFAAPDWRGGIRVGRTSLDQECARLGRGEQRCGASAAKIVYSALHTARGAGTLGQVGHTNAKVLGGAQG